MKSKYDTYDSLPQDKMPREKLLAYGAEYLKTSELIAVLLGTGSKEQSVLEVADLILEKYQDLATLAKASPLELSKINGIGIAKSVRISVAFELASRMDAQGVIKRKVISSPKDVCELITPKILVETRELFILILLNTKNKVISIETISVGSLNTSVVHPREVFKVAISWASAGVILVHNHPSGDPSPSMEDENLTRRMVECGNLLGIEILDHVIVGEHKYYSFKEQQQI